MIKDNIQVLLISPRLPSSDPHYGGDYGYTDLMLNHPPAGVQYTHYHDLLAQNQAHRIMKYYHIGPRLVQASVLPPDLWAEYLHSDFIPDVIHIYGFSAKLTLPNMAKRQQIPIILGTSTGSYSDLKYYLGWEDNRIASFRRRKRYYLQLIDAYDSSLRPHHADRVLTWSDFAGKMHLEEGFVCREQLEILPPGMVPLTKRTPRIEFERGTVFLFIGNDFERKNGQMVLDAFQIIHADYPETRLILIGKPQDERIISMPGVKHHHFVPRSELLNKLYQTADVLVLPSKAEGFGLVIVEAMSAGLSAIAVDAWAMPEIVDHEQTGFLIRPDNLEDLVRYMRTMVENPQLVQQMQSQSLKRFQERFSIEGHNQRLRQIYEEALTETSQLHS